MAAVDTTTISVTRPDLRKILLALDKLQVTLVKDDKANTHRPIIELSWAQLFVSGSHLVEQLAASKEVVI